MRRALLSAVGLVGMLAWVPACSSAPPTAAETVGTTSQAITTSTILSRADEWVTAKLLYCQAANHEADGDPSCPSTCTRTDNATWDPYRSDCSGFVSWAWGLSAPGLTTGEFAPADTSVSFAIDGADLQPGDALNIPDDHIILFVSWQTVGSVANFYEEPGCAATPDYAHAFTSSVTISGQSVYVDYEGKSFTAIRYTGITGATNDGGAANPTSCYSSTLGKEVVQNTCVQSAEDDNWYQCDAGSWVDRESDPASCVAVYPLTDGGVEPTDAGDAGDLEDATIDAPVETTADAAQSETACATAGGTCVSGAPGSCEGGSLGSQSCGLGAESICCVPDVAGHDAGAHHDAGEGSTHSSGSGSGSAKPGTTPAASSPTSSGGCSVRGRDEGALGDSWTALLGLGLVVTARRRRR